MEIVSRNIVPNHIPDTVWVPPQLSYIIGDEGNNFSLTRVIADQTIFNYGGLKESWKIDDSAEDDDN